MKLSFYFVVLSFLSLSLLFFWSGKEKGQSQRIDLQVSHQNEIRTLPEKRSLSSSNFFEVSEEVGMPEIDAQVRQLLRALRSEGEVLAHHRFNASALVTPLGTKVTLSAYQDSVPVSTSRLIFTFNNKKQLTAFENHYVKVPEVDLGRLQEVSLLRERANERYGQRFSMVRMLSPTIWLTSNNDGELGYGVEGVEKKSGAPVTIFVNGSTSDLIAVIHSRSEFTRRRPQSAEVVK